LSSRSINSNLQQRHNKSSIIERPQSLKSIDLALWKYRVGKQQKYPQKQENPDFSAIIGILIHGQRSMKIP
ncbi:MAG: hypothetical protein MHMPM18_003680, partial [Marteilia pararefringens]